MAKVKNKRTYFTGVIQKHKRGFGFVVPDDDSDWQDIANKDIFIAPESINGAMNGDRVEVDLIPKHLWSNSPEGIVVKILDRKLTEVVGTFDKNKKFGFVIPDGKKMREDIFINKKYFNGAMNGDKVVAEIIRYPEQKNKAEGKIIEVVSRKGEAGGDIKAMIRQYNLKKTFPSRVEAEAKWISKYDIKDSDIKERTDLRHVKTVTIDGRDSKDFDDAVSIKIKENGNYLLGVHIADVCHYVKEDGFLDKEAYKRGNSVYLINQVVPMLPEALSNGTCSLNPNEDRLTLTCEMEINKRGEIVHHNIYESIIKSKGRLVYEDVSMLIEAGVRDQENEFIFNMAELAEVLREKREKRGSLDFSLDEAHITLNEKGIPVNIGVAERGISNRMIEEFMLLANETVAEHFFWLEIPFIYRVHEKPSLEKMEEFKRFLKGLGISLRGNVSDIHPSTLNHILEGVKGKSYEGVVNTIMLRSMQKATYEIDCMGHFGLALKYYCHFTSPIRRYPDLMIHRMIKKVLKGNLTEDINKKYIKKCEDAALNSSKTEREAIELEREIEKMKMTEYMTYHIGEEFDGIISGVTNFGIYVELENCVEGMVRLDVMNNDYYEYQPEQYRVIGKKTNKIYALGDKVRIKVENVQMNEREIDFVII